MAAGVVMPSRLGRPGAGVMRGRIIESGARCTIGSRARRVCWPVVHGARVQRRWFLLDYEEPGRKECGECATTGSPPHGTILL